MVRLSIIVPFYNVEAYIEECIHSLYNQDIATEEYEVLCVDDCSQDGSRTIIKHLQKKYSTLKLLTHNENKRQGGARNTGLEKAKGNYVWFVDSDDYVSPNIICNLLCAAEGNNVDILQFDYHGENRIVRDEYYDGSTIQNGEDFLFKANAKDWIKKINGPWRQFFRKDFLVKSKVRFVEYVQYEDTDFILKAFLKAQRVQYVKIDAYCYRANLASTTLSCSSPVKLAWMVNQLMRCAQCISLAKSDKAKSEIAEMARLSLSSLRKHIKTYKLAERQLYINNLSNQNIMECIKYMNWRTLMAVRFGITLFI